MHRPYQLLCALTTCSNCSNCISGITSYVICVKNYALNYLLYLLATLAVYSQLLYAFDLPYADPYIAFIALLNFGREVMSSISFPTRYVTRKNVTPCNEPMKRKDSLIESSMLHFSVRYSTHFLTIKV